MLEQLEIGYEGLKAAFKITQGIQSLKTETAINEAVIDIQRHVRDAQTSLTAADNIHLDDLKRIDALEQEIVRMKDWTAEKKRYQLKRYIPGTFAYALKPEMADGEPIHRLCQNCYSNDKKSLLQAKFPQGRGVLHKCLACESEIVLGSEMADSDGEPKARAKRSPQVKTTKTAWNS